MDETALHPGDESTFKMRDSARKAPIGLVLFDENFVARGWPMTELQLIVEAGTLLPVAVGLSHEELKSAFHRSPMMLDETFIERVTRTTFLVDERGGQAELRERVCHAIMCMFVEKVCPQLPDTGRSMRHKLRVLNAAKKIEGLRLRHLTASHIAEAKKWVKLLESDIDK